MLTSDILSYNITFLRGSYLTTSPSNKGADLPILGIVGAGGIGFYIINYIKFFEYGKAAMFMLVVLVAVLAIDWISVKIRDKYIMKAEHGRQLKPMN